MPKYLFTVLILVISIFSILTNWYNVLVILLGIILLLFILQKMGNGIVLRESTAFLYYLTCLLMPLLGYEFYSYGNMISRLWVKYMPVSKETYFEYALPAISLFCLAITLPLKNNSDTGLNLSQTLGRIEHILKDRKKLGITIMTIGLIVSFFTNFIPVGLHFFVTLLFFASFAGLLYVYFTKTLVYRKTILLFFIAFIFNNALATGMFTIVAYMGVTIFSFFLLGTRATLLKKFLIICFAFVFILVLQNSKSAYRKLTWRSDYKENKAVLFSSIFIENLQKGEGLLDKAAFFPIYARLNQGYNVAMVMRRIPAIKPYDDGQRLLTVIASSLVPRFLWLDKPEAGGRFNMEYYAGFRIRGWSTNVGPLAEGYASFGVVGGIIFMFVLGLFVRWAYYLVLVLAKNDPLLVCWLPVLFFQVTYSAETDTLQILNSLIKSAFFLFLLVKLIPSWFGTKLESSPTVKDSIPASA